MQDQWMHQRLCGEMVTSSSFGQQTWLCMEVGKFARPFTLVQGPRQQNHHAMNIGILSNPHVKQKQNEKKALDIVKKKAKLE
jgi:5,10-methylenetetrahydrofolate reductase